MRLVFGRRVERIPEEIMTKKLWIQLFILPNLRALSAWLRNKDADSTGADDEAAEAIDFALSRLDKYLGSE